MTAQEIIERIMSHHWDMAACPCWLCVEGRKLGYCPREKFMDDRNDNRAMCKAMYEQREWKGKRP